MSCLFHLNQAKLPLIQDLLPPAISQSSIEKTPQPSGILTLLEHKFSINEMDLACYFLNQGDPYQLNATLSWFLKFVKATQKPGRIPSRLQSIMIQNFWSAFEKRPYEFLALFRDERNNLRRQMVALVFQPEIERLKTVVQKLPPMPLSTSFEGLLHLSNDLKLMEAYHQVKQVLEEITLNHPKKIPDVFRTPFQRYFYKIGLSEEPEALVKQAEGIRLLNQNLLHFLSKKREWQEKAPLPYAANSLIINHLIWSPFQKKLAKDLLTQDPTFISHLKFSNNSHYMVKCMLHLLAEANPNLYKKTCSLSLQQEVARLNIKDTEALLERLAKRARGDE